MNGKQFEITMENEERRILSEADIKKDRWSTIQSWDQGSAWKPL